MSSLPVFDAQKFIKQRMKQVDKKKKQQQQQEQWDPNLMEITQVCLPVRVDSEHMKRKFKIRVEYKDKKGKIRGKTIFFGDQDDYYFTKNQSQRLRKLVHMKHTQNPLHPNYWKVLLLNAYDSPQQGMKAFMEYFINKQLKKNPTKVYNKEIHMKRFQKMRNKALEK